MCIGKEGKIKQDPKLVGLKFIEAINTGDPDNIAELMTADHIFIDGDRGWECVRSRIPVEVVRRIEDARPSFELYEL